MDGDFIKKTGDRADGVAICWRSSRFELDHSEDVHMAQGQLLSSATPVAAEFEPGASILDRPQVAKIVVLRDRKANKRPLVVSSTHILYNEKRGDVKLGQFLVLLDAVARVVEKVQKDRAVSTSDIGVVMGGDFNVLPYSSLHAFMSSWKVNLPVLDSRNLSGQQIMQANANVLMPTALFRDGGVPCRYTPQTSAAYIDLQLNPPTNSKNVDPRTYGNVVSSKSAPSANFETVMQKGGAFNKATLGANASVSRTIPLPEWLKALVACVDVQKYLPAACTVHETIAVSKKKKNTLKPHPAHSVAVPPASPPLAAVVADETQTGTLDGDAAALEGIATDGTPPPSRRVKPTPPDQPQILLHEYAHDHASTLTGISPANLVEGLKQFSLQHHPIFAALGIQSATLTKDGFAGDRLRTSCTPATKPGATRPNAVATYGGWFVNHPAGWETPSPYPVSVLSPPAPTTAALRTEQHSFDWFEPGASVFHGNQKGWIDYLFTSTSCLRTTAVRMSPTLRDLRRAGDMPSPAFPYSDHLSVAVELDWGAASSPPQLGPARFDDANKEIASKPEHFNGLDLLGGPASWKSKPSATSLAAARPAQ